MMQHRTSGGVCGRVREVACLTMVCVLLHLAQRVHGDELSSWCFTPSSIPDGGVRTTMVEVFANASPQVITAVRVSLHIHHPWVGDLTVRMVHPSGAVVLLLDRPGLPSLGYPGPWGCGGDDLSVWFSDFASVSSETLCLYATTPTMSGSVRPTTALAALVGRAPQGVWTLIVEDAVAGDAGSVTLACLELTLADDCNGNGISDAVDLANGTSSDANADGVPDECACVADLNGDGVVGAIDLATLLSAWGECANCAADLTGDDRVFADDLAILLSAWTGTAGSSANGCDSS